MLKENKIVFFFSIKSDRSKVSLNGVKSSLGDDMDFPTSIIYAPENAMNKIDRD